jgi:hypothetical protein
VTWNPGYHGLALEGPETWRRRTSIRQICKASLLSSREVWSEENKFWKIEKLEETGHAGGNMCSLTFYTKTSEKLLMIFQFKMFSITKFLHYQQHQTGFGQFQKNLSQTDSQMTGAETDCR